MRWGLAILAGLAFAVVSTTASPVLLGICLGVGLLCVVALAVIFIDRHVRASARPEYMTEGELEALRTMVRKDAKPSARLPDSRRR